MRIWRLEFGLDEYDDLKTDKEWSIEKIREFDGREHDKDWEKVKVVRLEPEKKLPLSNAPGFFSHIVSLLLSYYYVLDTARCLPDYIS